MANLPPAKMSSTSSNDSSSSYSDSLAEGKKEDLSDMKLMKIVRQMQDALQKGGPKALSAMHATLSPHITARLSSTGFLESAKNAK